LIQIDCIPLNDSSDFYVYDIDSDNVIEMSRDSSKNDGPDAGFTQRATIDSELSELYVFSGLMREKNSTTETVKNRYVDLHPFLFDSPRKTSL
jgi:hypothetical protein